MRSLHTHWRLSHIHILCDTLAGMVATTLVAVVVAGAVAAPSRSLFRRSWGCLMARCAGCRTSAGSSSGQQVAHVRAFSAEKSVTMRASLSRVRAARQAAAGVRMVLVRRLCVRLANGCSPWQAAQGVCASRVAAIGHLGRGRCAHLQMRVLACRSRCAAASVSSACVMTAPFAILLCIISRLCEIV